MVYHSRLCLVASADGHLCFLKADYEKLKSQSEAELNAKLESKTKGLEKIVMENERLRRENRRVTCCFTV